MVVMKKFLDGWYHIGERVCHYLCYIAMVATFCMMVLMFLDSMCGLFLNRRLFTGVYEIVQCMLCAFVFISWSYTQANKGHMHVTLFISKMPRVARFICFAITNLATVVTMSFATYGAFKGFTEKLADSSALGGTLLIPNWPFYLLMAVAYVLFVVLLLEECIKAIVAIFNEEIANELTSEWV